jgi:hypothetical protein
MNTTELFLIAMATASSRCPTVVLVWRLGRTEYCLRAAGGRADRRGHRVLGPGRAGGRLPRALPDYYQPSSPRRDHRAQRRRVVGGDAVRLDRRHRAGPDPRPGSTGAKAASPPGWRWACRCCWAARRRCHAGVPGWMGRRARPGSSCWASAWLRRHRAADPDPADGEAGTSCASPSASASCATRAWTTSPSGACWRLILMDWQRVGRSRAASCWLRARRGILRRLMPRCPSATAGTWADLAGRPAAGRRLVRPALHGRRLPGRRRHRPHWFDQKKMDQLRHHVLLVVMPVFFLSTGLRTNWEVGGAAVFSPPLAAGGQRGRQADRRPPRRPRPRLAARAKPASSAGCCRPRR